MKHKNMSSGKGEKKKVQVILLTMREKDWEIFSLFLCCEMWNRHTSKQAFLTHPV